MLIVSLERTILQNIQTNFAIGNCVKVIVSQLYIRKHKFTFPIVYL